MPGKVLTTRIQSFSFSLSKIIELFNTIEVGKGTFLRLPVTGLKHRAELEPPTQSSGLNRYGYGEGDKRAILRYILIPILLRICIRNSIFH